MVAPRRMVLVKMQRIAVVWVKRASLKSLWPKSDDVKVDWAKRARRESEASARQLTKVHFSRQASAKEAPLKSQS
ncbi:hypothetical protein XI09_07265 [Bradyrhizobium sp. CCBAU 11386]|nr:hypothetical protein [Bradyrhizobium sp. CCBAU 11386]